MLALINTLDHTTLFPVSSLEEASNIAYDIHTNGGTTPVMPVEVQVFTTEGAEVSTFRWA